jgi:GTP pyrophosphokinase
MLDKEFRRLRQTSLAALKEDGLQELARDFKYPTVDDFLAAIGYGELSGRTVVLRHADRDAAPTDEDGRGPAIPLTAPASLPSGEVRVHGVGNMLTTFARCCKPVAGEPIRGYITRGKGVTVHRADCVSIRHAQDPDRLVEVEWERGAHQVFPITIKVEAWDRTGLLRDIAAVIAESKINLVGADVQVYDDRTAVISTSVEISNLTQLSRLLERLEQVRDVHTVARDVG